jgi:NAD(P) transhydrogenase subunit alpha
VILGIPKESAPGERRVALVPEAVRSLVTRGLEVGVERLCADYAEVASVADVVLKVQPPTDAELAVHREESVLIALLRPLDEPERAEQLAAHGVTGFALELLPRITRAQSMDVLSSQSTIAGYRAVVLAAAALPRIFPMLVTAAGTLQPTKLMVIGAGVAGLQALGVAKRLGAVTSAYDTRVAVREQVESIGARFVELALETGDAEDAGGYARAQSEDFYDQQREELARHVAASDVVITTALVPGQPAPRLITEDAVRSMRPGSVIVDLAAEKGGNCDCTEAGRDVVAHGVTIIGRTNLPAEVPAHASQMYAKNVLTFLDHLLEEDGCLTFDLEDEITAGTLVTRGGEVLHSTVIEQLAKRDEERV